ncbi:hypothetical protein [Puia dinghuensis]|uniref:DUF1554 domain-containing protein n=1 Tax=Puia dinghuensis TaxID=1792502 RepID=A0A8J2U868_9BACT|nr:hypothetical protein [Puia dinghuensis]GGA85896.1 hypothetical protein GCM10011511_06190 [Puia dinghuensis]
MNRLALVILLAGVLLACSKNPTVSGNATAFNSNLQTQANDQVRISTELDAAFNDVDSAIGKASAVCGGTITVDSVDTPRAITITYSGNTCNALRNRTGTIKIASTPGTSWTTAGDTATVTFTTVVITRLADSKTLTINGGFKYINISGGSLAGLSTSGATPVVHTISGVNINITYDNGTVTTWQFARKRTYTYNSGIVISTLGMDSVGGMASVADWGGNRFGNSVIVAPTSPLLINQSCNWQMTGGQETLNNPVGITALTFGLDTLGKAATGCPATGSHYFYNLSWTGTGENPYSTVLPY